MKSLTLCLLIFSGFAHADYAVLYPAVLITNIEHQGDLMPPILPGEKRITTTVDFEFSACRKLSEDDFTLKVVETTSSSVKIAIEGTYFIDCPGPQHRQNLTLTSQDVPAYANVYVLNPLLVIRNIVH